MTMKLKVGTRLGIGFGVVLVLMVGGAKRAVHRAAEAARRSGRAGGLALLVSCVGRKLVMGDRVDDEVEAVTGLLGRNTTVTGFYSNGEIAASGFRGACRLHNQTMTITWTREA